MKTKRRHNRRRKRRRTRRHRRRRTRRRRTRRRRRGAGNGMTPAEAALVTRDAFQKIANAVMVAWNKKNFYPVAKLTDAQLNKLQRQTARRVLRAMGGKDNMDVYKGIAGAKRIEKILNSVHVLQTRTIQNLIDNLNRRSVATATARAAALPTAPALNAGGGGGGGGGEAIYDTPPEDVAALFAASDLAAAMPVAPTTAPVAAAPTATSQRVAIAIPRETTGGRRRRRSRRRRRYK